MSCTPYPAHPRSSRPPASRIGRLASAMAAGLALAPAALAQDGPRPEFRAGTVLVAEYASLDQLFTHPKDAAFGRALAMIPSRVRELPREVRDMPPEVAGILNMLLPALARPGRLAIVYNGDNPSGGAFGYGAVVSTLTSGKEDADAMHAQVMALTTQALRQGGGPRPARSKRFPGMTDIQTPFALLSFGPREAKDGWRYEVAIGTVDNPDAVTEALPAPAAGMTPFFRARIDLAGVNPLMEMATALGGNNPEALEAMDAARSIGFGGPHPMRINYQVGLAPAATVALAVVEGAKPAAAALGMGERPIGKEDFAIIPADATSAYFKRGAGKPPIDLRSVASRIPDAARFLDEFHAHTNVDLEEDVLNALGDSVAVYMSDSTGGGGLGSAVAMLEIRDRTRLVEAVGKLTVFANSAADRLPLGPGYIRLVAGKEDGNDLLTLRFPGLPVPLELTVAMTPRWLIVGPTPQATLAATRQATGKGDAGLLSNKAFASSIPADRPLVGFSFTDTARHFAGGYASLSLIGSALANAVRSPADSTREPGLLVPLYNDLKRDVRPAVSFSYWNGDALVIESLSDRSALVNAAGAIGAIGNILPALIVPAAIAGAADQNRLVWLDGGNSSTTMAAALARQATVPFTFEHTALTLASAPMPHFPQSGQNDAGRVLWGTWIRDLQPAATP